ncbi:MAG: response regulator transcription factor [Phycisphaerales bacterium]
MAEKKDPLKDELILIVDDDPDVRESVVAAFRSAGATTVACGDGNSAVKLTHEKKPRLVILDMMLPGQSGFLVLEKIKGYEEAPFVIMITANEGKRHRQFATGLGADLYLQKPVSLEQLLDAARELVVQSPA